MSTTIDGFDYTIVGGEAWVVGYVGVEVNITIPSTIEGYQVGRIGYAAFENNYNIVSVLIPSNVNYIGNYAFSNCSNLVDINVNYGNPNYSSSFGVLYNKLQTNLICAPAGLTGALGIPPTVTTISDWAFAYSQLTSINMPNSVTNIGIYAFRNCRNLNNINIPGSVINIGDKAFSYCENLTWITVDSNNLNYSSLDGVLYNKSQSILICYPAGRIGAFIVPNSVTSINFSAFENCTKLTSITMGSSLNTIGDSAFEYCTNLESVIIGSGINNIADGGFYSCSKLKYIKFLGNAPSMGIQVFDNASSDFKVYYTYGKTGFTNPWYGYQTEALYIVIYNGNGNTSGTVPVDSNTYQLNQSVVVSDNTGLLQNSGHNFNGWNTKADGNGTHYEPGDSFFIGNNNIILYAQWTAYKVTYNGNGNTSGTVPIDSKEYKSGDTVKVLDNTGLLNKTGYSFGGWNTEADGSGTHYKVESTFGMLNQNVNLYVEWLKVHTIIYDGNGSTIGTAPVDSNEYLSDESVIILGNLGYLRKDNYVFRGWNTQSQGNGIHYNSGETLIMGNENVILYAQWSFEQLTILGKINIIINSNESITIKDSEPELAIISGDTVEGTQFEVGRITVNTLNTNDSLIKIDVIISTFSINFSSSISFRVIKINNIQSNETFIGPEWTVSPIIFSKTTISFFVLDKDFLNEDLCIYKLIATIN